MRLFAEHSLTVLMLCGEGCTSFVRTSARGSSLQLQDEPDSTLGFACLLSQSDTRLTVSRDNSAVASATAAHLHACLHSQENVTKANITEKQVQKMLPNTKEVLKNAGSSIFFMDGVDDHPSKGLETV